MSNLEPVVFSGPSGAGKSTLLKKLFAEFPDAFGFSVSHTTRQPRAGEVDGVDYHFVTREKMMEEIGANAFIEYADFASKMYGTSKKSIRDVAANNKICILDVDEQGVKNMKASDLDCKYVFVQPPSIEELEKRLRGRGSETEDSLKKRLETVQSALDFSKTGCYDVVITNDDLERAYAELKNFLVALFPKTLQVQSATIQAVGQMQGAGDGLNITQTATIDISHDNALVENNAEAGWYCSIL